MAQRRIGDSIVRNFKVSDLRIHPVAQRKLRPTWLKRLTEEMDLDAIGTLVGVEATIDGEEGVWIVDGQHRIRALLNHGFGEWVVRVELYSGAEDVKRACELFLMQNNQRLQSAHDKYRPSVVAEIPDAVVVDKVTRKHGLRVTGGGAADKTISCVATLRKAAQLDDTGEALDGALAIATDAWGKTILAVDGKIIDALSRMVHAHDGAIDRKAMVQKLAKYPGGAAGVLGDARGLRQFNRQPIWRCVAEVITETYNRRRSRDTQLPQL